MEQETGTQIISQPNTDFNFVRLRLKTEEFIKEIKEGLLGGSFNVVQYEDGRVERVFIKTGERLLNFMGAGSIEKILRMHINPHSVQGNFQTKNKVSERFEVMLEKFQTTLGNALIINKHKWDFDTSNYSWLVCSIRDSVEMFLSRCIDNLERESYGQTSKSTETNVVGKKGVFGQTG